MHQIVGADLRICAEADGSIKIKPGKCCVVSRKDHVSGVELTDGSFGSFERQKRDWKH